MIEWSSVITSDGEIHTGLFNGGRVAILARGDGQVRWEAELYGLYGAADTVAIAKADTERVIVARLERTLADLGQLAPVRGGSEE